ncbi:helix-turn-helix domain-containing protein [Metabacillus fastidiosus]|uniref:helix-turn-helix domain-containing protein n=1 Tax=Metabacillus fastidiosus TaxID=1458 RepID=UPI002E1C650E|nr:helix-turn-helix domain-containing protein [Metabacillus fastidiosus]
MSEKYVHISKASSLVGEDAYMLRAWEDEFEKFLTIKRDEKMARIYSPENIEMLRRIKNLKEAGLDKKTITLMLEAQQMVEKNPPQIKNKEETDEIKKSLAKIVEFIDSKEVENLLQLNLRIKKIEMGIKNTILETNKEHELLLKAQTERNQREFKKINEQLQELTVTSKTERKMYQEEIVNERQLVKEDIESRERKFLSFVREHQQKQDRFKHRKSGLRFIKNMIGFAK